MSTRTYDFGAGIAGIVFLVLGVLFLLDRLDAVQFRSAALLAGGAIGLGLALVASSLLRMRT